MLTSDSLLGGPCDSCYGNMIHNSVAMSYVTLVIWMYAALFEITSCVNGIFYLGVAVALIKLTINCTWIIDIQYQSNYIGCLSYVTLE